MDPKQQQPRLVDSCKRNVLNRNSRNEMFNSHSFLLGSMIPAKDGHRLTTR